MQTIIAKTKEEQIREMATKSAVCQSMSCPIREHRLRYMLKDYVPENFRIVTDVNLRKPKMQHKDCPQFCPDEPIRMPLGFKQLFYDMPGHLERDIKNYFINLFSRRRYYDYHCGRRPITPDVEQLICQALLNFGWQQEPIFDAYTEEYQL